MEDGETAVELDLSFCNVSLDMNERVFVTVVPTFGVVVYSSILDI